MGLSFGGVLAAETFRTALSPLWIIDQQKLCPGQSTTAGILLSHVMIIFLVLPWLFETLWVVKKASWEDVVMLFQAVFDALNTTSSRRKLHFSFEASLGNRAIELRNYLLGSNTPQPITGHQYRFSKLRFNIKQDKHQPLLAIKQSEQPQSKPTTDKTTPIKPKNKQTQK